MAEAGSSVFAVMMRAGNSRSSVLGMLASLAIVVGYFLPWTSQSGLIDRALGDRRSMERSASKDENAKAVVERLKDDAAVSGADWAEFLDAAADSGNLDERQQRRVAIASVTIHYLPYVAAGLAVLLLILSLPAGPIARVGGLPASAVLGVVQSRLFAGILMPIVMLLGLVVFTTMGTVFTAAQIGKDDPGTTGVGIILMLAGSGFALLSGFLGFGPGRVKALVVVVLIYLGLAAFLWMRAQA